MEIVRLNEENFASAVKRASEVLKKGGIVLYPTDTLYGLAVDAKNARAIEALRELKGREKKKPISIVVADVEDIPNHAEFPMHAKWYADRYLPGPLTLVLPGKAHLPGELMLNGQIGVRVPDDSFARATVKLLGSPITATSANRAGLPTLSNVSDILLHFGSLAQDIALVIDGGELGGGVPSSVLTFIDGNPYLLREGALTRADLSIS